MPTTAAATATRKLSEDLKVGIVNAIFGGFTRLHVLLYTKWPMGAVYSPIEWNELSLNLVFP